MRAASVIMMIDKVGGDGAMKIYAMGDIHGCYDAFLDALDLVDLSGNNKLVLLGDYIHGRVAEESYMVLDKIMELENDKGRDRVIVLLGNHERFLLDEGMSIGAVKGGDQLATDRDDEYIAWLSNLRRYYETEKQIFVHAGIAEEAGEYWEVVTDEMDFTDLYPPTVGEFYKDIVAGHVYTHAIAGDPNFFDIYYDGASHYYIDGDTLTSGRVPVLMYDTETEKYYDAESGEEITPYE